ncbi:NlpC/P60 family protein [Actinomadura napierensis]|uniref:NlpC/P60 family protein n=1 Tax=Actinomadura napierensis TaxID=267854 RepID=A0ABP5M0D5_9ACTN
MASPRAILIGAGSLALAAGTAAGLIGLTSPAEHSAAPQGAQMQADTGRTVAVAAVPKVTRAQVIARAKTWHPHTSSRVPYSQSKTHGGYRTDCSGYASMTLRLPKPGPNTVGLASSTYSKRIAMSQLKTGDLVIDAIGSNTTRHVVIFEKWTSSKHTAYWAYEQRGHYGTDHRTRTYGLAKGSQYKAYHPKNIT